MTQPLLPSRVPATVDALLAAARTVPGVQVVDGPTQGSGLALQPDVLAVAAGDVAVSETQERTGMGMSRRSVFAVMCVVSTWNGSPTMKPRRDRVTEILNAFSDALRADPTLGGVVETCLLGPNLEWRTLQDQGAVCEVAFEVTCRATI